MSCFSSFSFSESFVLKRQSEELSPPINRTYFKTSQIVFFFLNVSVVYPEEVAPCPKIQLSPGKAPLYD